jgi:hypothetical protein
LAGGRRPATLVGMGQSREQYWQGLIAEQERSGQTVREFAEARGLSPWSLYGWRSRLGRSRRGSGRRRGAGGGRKAAVESGQALVAVQVTGADGGQGDRGGGFELELEGGVRVHIPSGFDAQELSRLLAAVRSSC